MLLSLVISTMLSTMLFYLLMRYLLVTDIGITGSAVFATIYLSVSMLIGVVWF